MKKTVLILAALLIILSTFTGCESIRGILAGLKGATVTGDKAGETTDLNGAIMEYISSTSDALTVRMENRTDSTWQSGNMRDYHLEAEIDGEWYEVEQIGEFANTMELMIFAPGDEMTHTFSFSAKYGRLSPGKYRVVKSFWANATDTVEAHEFHLVCEFTVE